MRLLRAALVWLVVTASPLASAFEPVEGTEVMLFNSSGESLLGYGRILGGVLRLELTGLQESDPVPKLLMVVASPAGEVVTVPVQFGADGELVVTSEENEPQALETLLSEGNVMLEVFIVPRPAVATGKPGEGTEADRPGTEPGTEPADITTAGGGGGDAREAADGATPEDPAGDQPGAAEPAPPDATAGDGVPPTDTTTGADETGSPGVSDAAGGGVGEADAADERGPDERAHPAPPDAPAEGPAGDRGGPTKPGPPGDDQRGRETGGPGTEGAGRPDGDGPDRGPPDRGPAGQPAQNSDRNGNGGGGGGRAGPPERPASDEESGPGEDAP